MPWRDLTQSAQAKIDYVLGGTAVTSPFWTQFVRDIGLSDVTDFFIMLTAVGGFILICLRIRRAWKRRNTDG